MATWDAIVGGAGPAGAVAATVLARAGLRVLLIDRVSSARHKIGEALPGAARRLLRSLGLPPPKAGGPHRAIRGNSSAWGSAKLEATDFIVDPDGPGWRLDRLAFDRELREAAVDAGAVFRPGRVTRVTRRDAGWELRTDDRRSEKTRWLIDATGRASALARRLGTTRQRDAPLVAVYAFGRTNARVAFDRTLIEAAPHGWWYAAWLPSGVPVAALHVSPAVAFRLRREPGAWRRALADTRHVSVLFPPANFRGGLYAAEASGARLAQFTGDGWLACGDAALSFDPVSSQGIFFALQSGRQAARAILTTETGATDALPHYGAQLEKVRAEYLSKWRQLYVAERRWPGNSFWSARREFEL